MKPALIFTGMYVQLRTKLFANWAVTCKILVKQEIQKNQA